MKTAGSLAKTLAAERKESVTSLTTSQDRTLKKTVLPQHWISALFKKLQARYGHKWTSAIDGIEQTAVEEWSKELGGLTGDEIAYGLDNWVDPWPPSSIEFKAVCKGVRSKQMHKQCIALPKPKCNMDLAKKNIKKMKQLTK